MFLHYFALCSNSRRSNFDMLAFVRPVADWWRIKEWSRFLFVSTNIILAYFSNLLISHRAPELTFCVCARISTTVLAHFGGSIRFISDFTGVEDTAAWGLLLDLPECVRIRVQSSGCVRIMSDCTANLVTAYHAYTRLLQVDWLLERNAGGYRYKAAARELSSVPPCSICYHSRAADRFPITCKVVEAPVRFKKDSFMKMCGVHNATEATDDHLDERKSVHFENVSKCGVDGDGKPAERIWYLHSLITQSACGVSNF